MKQTIWTLVVLATGMSFGAQAEQKWHPVEAATITYSQTGMQTGTSISAHIDYGRKRYEENDLMLDMMGFKQATKDWNVYIDDLIYHGDPATMIITKTVNPLYDQIKEGLEDKSPEEVAITMFNGLGMQKTGETRSYAGEDCEMWAGGQLGMSMCFTEDMLLLYMNMAMGPASMERTATSVERGSGGPADRYEIPKEGYTVTDGPDLNQMFQEMQGN